jgi:hypothetical protein
MAEERTTESGAMENVRALVAKLAPSNVSVLIRGGRGVGKSFLAKTIHRMSGRIGELVTVNCDAPEEQIEVDLFGLLEAARGGTLFLRSVDELPWVAQAALLKALETKSALRVIAATRRDVSAACEVGHFRPDLLARLSSITIVIPPLRERIDDLPRLASEFLQDFRRESGRDTAPRLTPEALERLRRYPWPGNVAELQAVIRRAVLLSKGPEIAATDLTVEISAAPAPPVLEPATPPSSEPTDDASELECSLCGDAESQVRMLFRGADAQICDQCVTGAQAATCAAPRPSSGAADRTDIGCAFCKRSAADVGHLVGAEDDPLICDRCLDDYDELFGERFPTGWPRGRTFTLRTMYPGKKIDDSTAGARHELTHGRPCRIVVLAGDGTSDPARVVLDRMKASLADIADFWESEAAAGVDLAALALPRPAPHA